VRALPTTAIALALLLGSAARASADDERPLVIPTALLQLDGQAHPQDEEGQTGFSIARMRAGVWSHPNDVILGLVQAEFADPEHPTILDGYVRLGPWQGLRVTAGYSRSPLFVSARTELEGMGPMPELSMPVRALWPGRDVGVELHYTPAALPMEMWLRVGNGSSSPFENDDNSFAFTGRVDVTSGRGRWNATGLESTGLRIGIGALTDDTYDRAGAAGDIATGFTFYRPPTVSGPRRVVEGHALAYVGPVRALVEVGGAVEGRAADTDGNPATPRVNLDPSLTRGGAVELAWMITGEKRVSGVWPVGDRANKLSFDDPAIEVAARAERTDLGRGMRDVPAGGATGGTVAANVWLNELLAVSAAGYLYHYDRAPIEETQRLDSWLFLARVTLFLNPPPISVLARPSSTVVP
jgi:phosphate-selective porin OprO/OprP